MRSLYCLIPTGDVCVMCLRFSRFLYSCRSTVYTRGERELRLARGRRRARLCTCGIAAISHLELLVSCLVGSWHRLHGVAADVLTGKVDFLFALRRLRSSSIEGEKALYWRISGEPMAAI